MTCSTEVNPSIVSDAFPPPILLDEEMENRCNHMTRNDFPSLSSNLDKFHQNQVAGHLGSTRKDFQEKFTTDDFRLLEENNQSVEKKFGEDTQTDIMALKSPNPLKE